MLSVRVSRVTKPTQAEPATLDIEQDRAKTRELRGVPALALKTPDDLDAAVALIAEHTTVGSSR